MASTNTSITAARRYAGALIDNASDQGAVNFIEQDMADLSAMLEYSADLRNFVKSPLISTDKQQQALEALSDKAGFNQLTRNFLLLLAENRRLYMLGAAVKAVKDESAKRRGEISADVQTAAALSDSQTKALQETIAKALGRNVAMNVTINKDLIGGLVVQVGSTLVDASVKNKIQRLSRAMMAGQATAS